MNDLNFQKQIRTMSTNKLITLLDNCKLDKIGKPDLEMIYNCRISLIQSELNSRKNQCKKVIEREI